MKAQISNGNIILEPENATDKYAIEKWYSDSGIVDWECSLDCDDITLIRHPLKISNWENK